MAAAAGSIPWSEAAPAPAHVDILGCNVSRVTLTNALDVIEEWIGTKRRERCRVVVATGFHGIWEAHKDPAFQAVLNSADLFCPDGIAPVWLSRIQGEPLVGRVPGPDLLEGFLERGNRSGYRSFFMGDTPETLAALRRRIEQSYPGNLITGILSPSIPMDPAGEARLVEQINAAHPDVLWVALGLPKQEWWIDRNRRALRVPVVAAVGAAFGFVSGRVRRAPPMVGRLGFEWAWRLAMEPRKLWRRDLMEGPRFLVQALLSCAAFPGRHRTAHSRIAGH